jgi:group I intron endonuclease
MNSGIYVITSPSGGQYIGSAIHFGTRWRQHQYELRKGSHFNRALQRAMAKYGIEQLRFEKLLVCHPTDLLMFEQIALDGLNPRYNACPIAGSQLGRRHTHDSNEKNAAAHRGKSLTPEHREKLRQKSLGNQNMKGKLMPCEVRDKISAALKGRGPSSDHMQRLHHSNRGRKKSAEEIARRQTTRAANQMAAMA